MLYSYGVQLGMQLMLNGQIKKGLQYTLNPVNYWRTLEYRHVFDLAGFQEGDRVLDIGSPKLLSLYLADRLKARVTSTDIHDYFIPDFRLFQRLKQIPSERLRMREEDGRALSFPGASFDKVYSISVVEHIPDDGDSRCVKEIKRVLAPGGRCLITVPFSPKSRVDYCQDGFYWDQASTKLEDGRIFFQRRYSETDLFERLIIPSGMRLKHLKYFGETLMPRSERQLDDYLNIWSGPVQPLLSKLFLSKPADSWKDLKKPLCALLVLEN